MEKIIEQQGKLASRWSRLAATIIDSLILSAFMTPLLYFTDGFDRMAQNPYASPYYLIMVGVGFFLYGVINWKLLSQSGQTVGKRILKIKVVNEDGSRASIEDLLFRRYGFIVISSAIPVIGGLINLVSMLMIFGKKKQTLHDRVVDSKVIVCV